MDTSIKTRAIPSWGRGAAREALLRGDRRALIAVVREAVTNDQEALEDLAQLAIELRRQNVSVIGAHDVFVRRTDHGELRQVIAPVRLSLADDTIYQLPVWSKYRKGTAIEWEENDGAFEWKAVVPDHAKHKATITAFGLHVINKVAGCAIGQPDSVFVDGVERTNPFVERAQTSNGRPGDIVRVVLRVNVVGPAPATGNPVVVQYTLDVDPSKDLQHMLMQQVVKDKVGAFVYLVDEADWEDIRIGMPPADRQRWKLLPLYGGVGIAHDLRNVDVQKAYQKHINLIQNALKKAQTVARRNAMRAHPALAYQTVVLDQNGSAVVAVTGWMSSDRSIGKYAELLERMSRGLPTELAHIDQAEVIDVDDTYDPAKVEHQVGPVGEGESVDATIREEAGIAPADAERNELVHQVDLGLALLTPAQVGAIKYDPVTATTEQLRELLTQINRLVDSGSRQ